jgi:hypothetical protein
MLVQVDDTYLKERCRGVVIVAVMSLAEMLLLLAAGKWSPRYASSGCRASVVVVGALVSVFICAVVVDVIAPVR